MNRAAPVAAPLQSILYVEDDPQVRTLATMALELIGHFTVRDCSPGQAVRTAANFEPDLILLDVREPVLDGLATLGSLRRCPHLAQTPVLFVTGAAAFGELAQLTAAGAIGMIAKPIEPMRLAGQLRTLWERTR